MTQRDNKKNTSLKKKIEKGNLGGSGNEKKCQGTRKKDEKIFDKFVSHSWSFM